jgi:hypothetical protein
MLQAFLFSSGLDRPRRMEKDRCSQSSCNAKGQVEDPFLPLAMKTKKSEIEKNRKKMNE